MNSKQQMISRRVRKGYNEAQSVQMLEELIVTMTPLNLPLALVHHNFATEAMAETFMAELLVNDYAPAKIDIVRRSDGSVDWDDALAKLYPLEDEATIAASWSNEPAKLVKFNSRGSSAGKGRYHIIGREEAALCGARQSSHRQEQTSLPREVGDRHGLTCPSCLAAEARVASSPSQLSGAVA